jgi:hypothetical protein
MSLAPVAPRSPGPSHVLGKNRPSERWIAEERIHEGGSWAPTMPRNGSIRSRLAW